MHVIWFDRPLRPEYLHLLPASVRAIGPADGQRENRFAALPAAQAIIAGGSTQYTAEVIAAGPNLRAICRTGIGTDNVDIAAATDRGIAVCNAPDGPTVSTAEHTIALLLAVAKFLEPSEQLLRQGARIDFFNQHVGVELMGLKLGLVGMGRIGRRVARIASQGFEMRVSSFDPGLSDSDFLELGVRRVKDLDALLQESDVVSLHVPLAPQTHHLVNWERLKLMKRGAILVNAGRGGLVDEAALLEVLQSGHLLGAGIDVFEHEPPPADHPLLHLPNVVATPHVAAATGASKARLWEAAINQAVDVLEGRRPANLVNPAVWKETALQPN
jgi:D-3-phosphoglycerate dehydrogenase